MKIAAITDDGTSISQHFGRAQFYLVVTVENGKIIDRELREKLNHSHFANETHDDHHGQGHGFTPAAQDRHTRMAQAIDDCEALLCRGMGAGAYSSMQSRSIRPIVTDIPLIDDAVLAYLDGSIQDHTERLH